MRASIRAETSDYVKLQVFISSFRARLFEVITFRPQRGSYTPHVARNLLTVDPKTNY